jgi:hypothetical protein
MGEVKIKNVSGDVVASSNQSGGVTAKLAVEKSIEDSEGFKYKKTAIVVLITFALGVIGFFADVFGILDYFNVKLFTK